MDNNPISSQHEAQLSDYTSFRLGGSCPYLITCNNPETLIQTLEHLNKESSAFVLIGSGSNIVVSDQGLDVPVIRYLSPTPLIKRDGNILNVAASTLLDDLALFCVHAGLEGLNFTSGIPGTVGGAVTGNAGAWGKQIGDCVVSGLICDRAGRTQRINRDDFAFSYRHSRLKDSGEILLSVTCKVDNADAEALSLERARILKERHEKHPCLSTHPCAGSFFRNIEPSSHAGRRQASGWFLEEAGGKNLRVGGAYVFPKHANIIIKGQGCSAQDVHDLHLQMIAAVEEKFGIQLAREVRFAGTFQNTLLSNPRGFW